MFFIKTLATVGYHTMLKKPLMYYEMLVLILLLIVFFYDIANYHHMHSVRAGLACDCSVCRGLRPSRLCNVWLVAVCSLS
jgi:hypothetical protein